MTARVQPDPARLEAARALLGHAGGGGDLAAVAWVAADVDAGVPPDAEVLLAAVTLLHGARAQLDAWELAFIDHARAQGSSWGDLGRAAGYAPGAKQGAAARRRRLAAARDTTGRAHSGA